jgi:hypothetical protein
MDPLTLFALANGAVSAIKKGCQLYKDIKGAAGDVKDVLKDLDDQFNNAHKNKPPTPEARTHYIEEKNRVIELNKKGGETDDIYAEIGEKLGDFFDAYHKCRTVLEEEEKHSRDELYTGDASLGKRALQRVLMKKKLEQMQVDLRETVVYQSPPELGALWTDVNKMMEELGKQQEVHLKKKIASEARAAKRKAKFMRALKADLIVGGGVLSILISVGFMMAWIAYDAQKRHPEWKAHDAQSKLELIRKEEIKKFNFEIEKRSEERKAILDDLESSRHPPGNSQSN